MHSKQVVSFRPIQWFLMLDNFELIPRVSTVCKRVREITREHNETKAIFDIVWKGTPQISLQTHQKYQILSNGDIEIQASVSGMPFEFAEGKWILHPIPDSPHKTEVFFTFKWGFQKWVYGLIGTPIIHSLLGNIISSIQKQMQKEFS